MTFTTRSGKKFELDAVIFHKESKTLQHPNKPMIFFPIPAGLPTTPWNLTKALRAKGVTMN